MFPKGPRFQRPKPNDVPGPGSYNINEPDYAAYKRGAFLEKADRFRKEPTSDGPGPNAYIPSEIAPSAPLAAPPLSTVVKQQLDNLRARLEKEHQKELQQLEARLSKAEARNQEILKETTSLRSTSMHSEKELRLALQRETSLRSALEKMDATLNHLRERAGNYSILQKKVEHLEFTHTESTKRHRDSVSKLQDEHQQLRSTLSTQGKELAEIKASLDAEKASQIISAQAHFRSLENLKASLAQERSRRESAEQLAREARQAFETTSSRCRDLENEVKIVHEQLATARSSFEDEASTVYDLRDLLNTVAQQYGAMASTTVSKAAYRELQVEKMNLEMQVLHLDRKLADRQGQVTELVQMIRHVSEQNQLRAFEKDMLCSEVEALRQASHSLSLLIDTLGDSGTKALHELIYIYSDITSHSHSSDIFMTKFVAQYDHASSTNYISTLRLLTCHLGVFTQDSERAGRCWDLVASFADREISKLSSHLQAAQTEIASKEEELLRRTETLMELRKQDEDRERRTQEAEECLAQEIEEVQRARTSHATQIKSMNATMARARMAEQALKEDVANLELAVSDAVKFQDAHDALLKQVEILVSRNVLAEEEADRLSRFNAQILGHTNANQRIYYVDRLRKEMADVKQRLLTVEWERNAVKDENIALLHELQTYKSVDAGTRSSLSVSAEVPPRAQMTRVGRAPLSTRSTNAPDAAREVQLSTSKDWTGVNNDARMSVTELLKS